MIRNHSQFFALFAVVIFCSCDSDRVYETNANFPDKFWYKDSTQIFQFTISDPSVNYNLYINLRNTATYDYQNIYIQYDLKDANRKVLESQLRDFQLFHPQTGKPFGSSGIGDIFDHQLLLLENYSFPDSGLYSLNFTQMMRVDSLPEILSLGARVEVNQNK